MNPFDVLAISADADDETVRKAYLDLVRRFSPDIHPTEFKRINRAYEAIRDEKARLTHYLFNTETPAPSPFQTLVEHYLGSSERTPLDLSRMKEFLQSCAKT